MFDKLNYERNYYKKNRLRLLEQSRQRRLKNWSRVIEVERSYFRRNKLKLTAMAHEWTKNRIKEIWDKFGNRCIRCGFDNVVALEIHHKDGSHRSQRRSRDYTKLGYDLNRIELICANCHKIEHYATTKINI